MLQLSKPHITESKGRYGLSQVTNALKNTPLESPIPPFGGGGHFDISKKGIVFVAKDPSLNPATNTKCIFYYLPISSFTTAASSEPRAVQVDGFEGACTSPVFSPNGQAAVFLQMKKNGYESDKNRIFLISDLTKLSATTEVLKSDDGKGLWDRSPQGIMWSNDGKTLFLTAEDEGEGLLFKVDIPATPPDMNKLPEKVTNVGYVADMYPLSDDSSHLFLSGSSLVDSSIYSTVDPTDPSTPKEISSYSRRGASFGLSKDQVLDIWFKGAGDYKVHAWVMKPSTFKEGEKYPLAYLIYGGL